MPPFRDLLPVSAINATWSDATCAAYLAQLRRMLIPKPQQRLAPERYANGTKRYFEAFDAMRRVRAEVGRESLHHVLAVAASRRQEAMHARVLQLMEASRIEPDARAFTTMLTLAHKCGDLAAAIRILDDIEAKGFRVDLGHHAVVMKFLIDKQLLERAFRYWTVITHVTRTAHEAANLNDMRSQAIFAHQALRAATNLEQVDMVWHRLAKVAAKEDPLLLKSVLRACARLGEPQAVESYAVYLAGPQELEVLEVLMTAYKEAGDLNGVVDVFRAIYDNGLAPGTVSFEVFIQACLPHVKEPGDEFVRLAEQAFNEADDRGLAGGKSLFTCLIEVYARAGDTRGAAKLARKLLARNIRPTARWNIAMSQLRP
ncbi:hypothetical protein DIPPA_29003 [Diplonema papillatum]|nr:hypothetical protein DIPPA_29003 [Diplonema papillatum]